MNYSIIENAKNTKKISYRFLDDPNEILRYLQLGINLPIWPEFHEYILFDLKYYKAKSILLHERGNPLGNTLIYDDGKDILYFGYFGVLNHKPDNIDFLIKIIIKFARENNFKQIRGPINIPIVIFGWGFMKENSLNSLFACKPVNPPIYQELFFKNGFKVLHEDLMWEAKPWPIIDPWKLKKYDFSEYEYFNPKDKDDFMKMKPEFLGLVSKNLPSSSLITPSVAGVYNSYIDYIFKFGNNFFIFFVRHKPSGKLVACGNYLPNPFRKNSKGNFDSCIIHTWVVDPNHRRKGLIFLMYGASSLLLKEKNIKYGGGTISSDNLASTEAAKALGGGLGRVYRTHLILEYLIGTNED